MAKKNRKLTTGLKLLKGAKKYTPWGIALGIGTGMLSKRFGEVRDYIDEYNTHWLERLGHEGPPLKEDSIYRGDIAAWETDYREYWDTKPLY